MKYTGTSTRASCHVYCEDFSCYVCFISRRPLTYRVINRKELYDFYYTAITLTTGYKAIYAMWHSCMPVSQLLLITGKMVNSTRLRLVPPPPRRYLAGSRGCMQFGTNLIMYGYRCAIRALPLLVLFIP